MRKIAWTLLFSAFLFVFSGCGESSANSSEAANVSPLPSPNEAAQNINQAVSTVSENSPTPESALTDSPLGRYDFKNHTYPLPHGWQGEMREITLENGRAPLSLEEENRKIGASLVKTKYGDVTGDQEDEAFVIVKIETGGAALPQVVYVFEWKNEKPEIIWFFRTGDRADGGLREIKAENNELIIELYGQDRYIFGEVETLKIPGDEEQLCCPTFYTRNRYRLLNGRFTLQGKRLTHSIAAPQASPVENMGEIKIQEEKKAKK